MFLRGFRFVTVLLDFVFQIFYVSAIFLDAGSKPQIIATISTVFFFYILPVLALLIFTFPNISSLAANCLFQSFMLFLVRFLLFSLTSYIFSVFNPGVVSYRLCGIISMLRFACRLWYVLHTTFYYFCCYYFYYYSFFKKHFKGFFKENFLKSVDLFQKVCCDHSLKIFFKVRVFLWNINLMSRMSVTYFYNFVLYKVFKSPSGLYNKW